MNREPFLPNTSMQYLENLYREERDAAVRTRLQAYIMKKEGQRTAEIAKRLRIPRITINDWIRKARDTGKVQHKKAGGKDQARQGAAQPAQEGHPQGARQVRV